GRPGPATGRVRAAAAGGPPARRGRVPGGGAMNDASPSLPVRNGQAVDVAPVPDPEFAAFRRAVVDGVEPGRRVASVLGSAPARGQGVDVWAILADDAAGLLHVARSRLLGDWYPALTPDVPEVHWFERELAEQWGVRPEGHPWLKPVRFHPSYRPGHDAWGRNGPPTVGVTDYYRIEGEEIHEVAVGPVHAGVIEPGHFRLQDHGEPGYHLEIALGYQHRGVERALRGGPDKRSIHYMETLAGDTSIGHALAYCQALEALGGSQVPARAQALRGIALELERL